jgi:acyl-CoA dehydrogenase
MMDFSLSPELTELRARVRALVDDVLQPVEDEAERSHGRLSAETHARIHRAVLDSGLAANNIPKEFGGGGFNLTEQIVTHEQLGRLTNCLWVLVWSPSNVLVHGTPEQIERYLIPDVRGEHRHAYAITEGDAGSDPRAIEAEAVWNGEHYELSGTKWFVTDGDVASYFIVLAWAVDGNERLPALFLVDKDSPGVEMTADPDFTHNFPYRHPEFTFTKTPVPRENILGERGRGFELTGEWFIEERVHIAARCVGACDRLIELGTDWALHREQFGGRIFDHQAVSFALADCAAEVTAARLLTYYVGWLADTGADRKLVHHKAAMAKLVASETAGRVADRVVQIFGGRGYMRENPAERLWRELRVDRIWEGTSEIQRLIIARGLERRGPATLLGL